MPKSATHAPYLTVDRAFPPITEHIVVATAGGDTVSPALRVGRALADRFGSTVDVLSIVEPLRATSMVTDVGLVAPLVSSAPGAALLQERRYRVADELARAGRPEWSIAVRGGWPSEQIVECAKELGATLIVMGIGRHTPIDRLMGSETALQVIQMTDTPVLAVAATLAGAPRTAVAALDFTEQSERAAHAMSELLMEEGTPYLTHVRSDWTEQMDPQFPVDLYADGVERRFEQLARRLSDGHVGPRRIETLVRLGDAAQEILAAADVNAVDVIAVGARAHSRLHRIFLGSVAAKLLRSAHCSVLVIPAGAEQRGAPASR